MIYRAIGLMSGSSLDGLDIVFASFQVNGRTWTHEVIEADCFPYSPEWSSRLAKATSLSALDYQLLHADYGHYLGSEVNRFIANKAIDYQVALVSSHGHTSFHLPPRMTAQLGDGAALAAETGLPVITDLRALDVAFGGQGAPIVPMGEKMLWPEYSLFLNIGGIANVSVHNNDTHIGFDICPANRVLNLIIARTGKSFDDAGNLAREGQVDHALLQALNVLPYYEQSAPKSLANTFGTDVLLPMIEESGLSVPDALRTFVEHIAQQTYAGLEKLNPPAGKMLVTGGGAYNKFLVERIGEMLLPLNIEPFVPEPQLIEYKEAIVMAFLGVLRWREEATTLPSVTGARRESIGGAVWLGNGF